MNYEAVQGQPAGTPMFTDNTFQTLKFQINTKVNVVGNTYLDTLAFITCNDNGIPIWYTLPSADTSTIYAYCQAQAELWVALNYPSI